MQSYLQRVLFILGTGARRRLVGLVTTFGVLSALDLFGISLVGPFLASVANPEFLKSANFASAVQRVLPVHSEAAQLAILGTVLIAIFYVKGVLAFLVFRAAARTTYQTQRELRLKLLQSYQAIPLLEYANHNSSRLLTSVQQHAAFFTNRALLPALKAISEAIFLLAMIGLLMFTSLALTLALGGTLFFLFAVYDKLVKDAMRRAGRHILQASEGINRVLSQAADGFKEIRVLGVEHYFLSTFDRFAKVFCEASTQSVSLGFIPRYAIEATMVTFLVLAIVFGFLIHGHNGGELLSTLGIFGVAALRSVSSVNSIISAGNELRFARQSVWDLCDDLKSAERTHRAEPDPGTPLFFQSELCAEGVSFSYDIHGVNALTDVSLCVKKGATIGIIGRSGCGKTTLVDVLLGLLPPTHGAVFVDGIPISGRARAWMQNVAYIPQGVFLMDDTLEQNIALGGDPGSIDPGRLAEAIKLAQLQSVVGSLPKGLQTTVGERGVRLSGGQRQRIALARAFYHEREVIVMDEATSALDTETERQVVDAIKNLRGKKTLIVVAHRLSTVKHCDIIYRLEAGRIVASGSYEKVVGDV